MFNGQEFPVRKQILWKNGSAYFRLVRIDCQRYLSVSGCFYPDIRYTSLLPYLFIKPVFFDFTVKVLVAATGGRLNFRITVG